MTAPEENPGPVALVTGAAVRVGRALAFGLAGAGYYVAVHYGSSADAAEEVVRRLRSTGRRAEAFQADLGDPDAAPALADAVAARFGRIDVLVNSAASFDRRPLDDVDADVWDRVMALNARAPHLLARAARPRLRERGGSVVNVVDLSAFRPWSDYPAHSVAKAALAHLTRVQAKAWAPEIRVNAVAPGAVLAPDDWDDDARRALVERTPLARWGTPDDVVGAVLYLVGARYVTGQILVVDGGRSLSPGGSGDA